MISCRRGCVPSSRMLTTMSLLSLSFSAPVATCRSFRKSITAAAGAPSQLPGSGVSPENLVLARIPSSSTPCSSPPLPVEPGRRSARGGARASGARGWARLRRRRRRGTHRRRRPALPGLTRGETRRPASPRPALSMKAWSKIAGHGPPWPWRRVVVVGLGEAATIAALSGSMASAGRERWRLVWPRRKLKSESVRGWPSSRSQSDAIILGGSGHIPSQCMH